MIQEIYIVDDKGDLTYQCKDIFQKEPYKINSVHSDNLDAALKNIPAMIIVDDNNTIMDTFEICRKIRRNEDNAITPVLVVSTNTDRNYRIEIFKYSVLFYIVKPVDNDYFYFLVKNTIDFVNKNRTVSPLTGLPGNVQIQAEMKKRLLNKQNFAVFYYDLDNFKAYNDVYGFSNGDEIIKFTARTIQNVMRIQKGKNYFVGHIGGDDFISIIDQVDYDAVCQGIIDEFDSRVSDFYNDEDVERGFVEVANRKGIIEQFPLVSISIAVIEVDENLLTTPLEIGEISAQIKHKAKEMIGSSYVINRRKF